ncbi:hypothetical protein D3C81_1815380 [compost metagenome]
MPQVSAGLNIAAINENIRSLEMNSNAVSVNTITVGDPVKDFYKTIYDYLNGSGYNVVYFGYDWRKDNNRDQTMELSKLVPHQRS